MNESSSFGGALPYRGRIYSGGRLGPPDLARHEDFRLGKALVRPSVRTVEGAGGTVVVEPRVMQVLVALVDAGGEVLTRDDLIRVCWKGQIVGDDAVNRAISAVRRAARETDGGFGVETIPRIGFRLLAEENGELQPVAPPASAGAPDPASRVSRRALVAGGLALAGAAGAGLWFSRSGGADPAAGLIEDARSDLDAGTPEANLRAIATLEKATGASPANGEAWGLLALAVAQVDDHAIDRTQFPVEKVTVAANRALRLDPANADAQAALALSMPYYGDWLAAEKRFAAILERHPDHLPTLDSRSFFLGAVGRMRESARDRQAFASRGSSNPNMVFRQVYALWFLDRIADADRVATGGLQTWPRHPGLWFAKLWVLAGTGRIDRAVALIADEAGRPPLPPPMLDTLRAAMSAAGDRDPGAVDAAAGRIVGGVGQSVAAVVNAIMLLNLIGAIDQAFAVSEAYYLEEGPLIPAMSWRPGQPFVPDQRRRKTNMLFTPMARPMQADPRFMPLMERMGLARYWNRRGVTPDFLAPIKA
ncbi:winged helix-turn-helix domain-containing protein [Tsuneonella sp. YG55]|uniref:Winged helix-turn-helix domain-containing protein n=1 Tax=Tsuneonella litorea TaxID=2976475 RepID=A0A9X2VY84_9SPHN|nr:winged helix-turn-helix domain-containing protein [Tsuneonella litorea]MCT2557377.1 winged helix-turn-helix domain-containing protein [Tsuneonella litorea]